MKSEEFQPLSTIFKNNKCNNNKIMTNKNNKIKI